MPDILFWLHVLMMSCLLVVYGSQSQRTVDSSGESVSFWQTNVFSLFASLLVKVLWALHSLGTSLMFFLPKQYCGGHIPAAAAV